MSSGKRGSVSRRGVRLRGVGSGKRTSTCGKEGKVVVTMWEIGVLEVSGGGGGEVGGGVTWDPGEQEGEGDHKEGAGVGSVPLQL